MRNIFIATVLTATLSLMAHAIQKRGVMPSDPENPIESLSIVQNPDNPEQSAILVQACGGKKFAIGVPTKALSESPQEVIDYLVKRIKEVCGETM